MNSPLIVITTPCFFQGEITIIHRLFENGLMRLHVRKPGCDRSEMKNFLKAIDTEYLDRIVLHDWFDLAQEMYVGGIHLNQRNPQKPERYHGRISRSCHSLEEVEQYKSTCDYLFLSPIFPSISKEGYGSGFTLEKLRKAGTIIDRQVIALGGICLERIRQLQGIPFGGFAVLGALWGTNPSLQTEEAIVERFKQLQTDDLR